MLKKEFLLENVETVRLMYIDNNCTVKEVSEKFNCSTSVLQRFLRENNISKRTLVQFKDLPSKENVEQLIEKGLEYSEICKTLEISNVQLSKILEIGNFSNTINESLLFNDSPILWYLLGIISSDGHNSNFNSVDIFQKDATYLNNLKAVLEHKGTLYKNGDGYCLRINSPYLTKILNSKEVASDKRYSVCYMKAPNKELESCFVRGLFDGDGCIYYNYVSGAFKNMRMEVTSGSPNMRTGLETLFNELSLNYTLDERISIAKNPYYVIYVRSYDDIEKFGNWIYSNSLNIRLVTKYKKYIKFLKLIKLDKEVDDIVGTN